MSSVFEVCALRSVCILSFVCLCEVCALWSLCLVSVVCLCEVCAMCSVCVVQCVCLYVCVLYFKFWGTCAERAGL